MVFLGGSTVAPKSWNMGLGRFLLEVLLSLVWDRRTVFFPTFWLLLYPPSTPPLQLCDAFARGGSGCLRKQLIPLPKDSKGILQSELWLDVNLHAQRVFPMRPRRLAEGKRRPSRLVYGVPTREP